MEIWSFNVGLKLLTKISFQVVQTRNTFFLHCFSMLCVEPLNPAQLAHTISGAPLRRGSTL